MYSSHTWYLPGRSSMFCVVPVTNEYILGHTLNWNNITSMYQDEPSMYWYIRDKTKCMALHDAQNWTEDLMHTKQHIIPLHCERTLVILRLVVCTRYIYTVLDTLDVQYLLAGDGRPARVPQRPPLLPWCHWSWHQLGLGFQVLGSPGWLCKTGIAWKLPCGARPPPDWETGP